MFIVNGFTVSGEYSGAEGVTSRSLHKYLFYFMCIYFVMKTIAYLFSMIFQPAG